MRWFVFTVMAFPSLALSADGSFSAWAYDYFIDGASVKLGYGTKQAGIAITRNSDNAEGRIVQRNEDSWFLSYSTSPVYFSVDKAGLTFIFNVSGFNANQQEVSKDEFVDLGSRTSGRFYYIVPTAFYEWGDYRTGIYTRVGAGIGVGFAEFNGDVLLTSTAGNDSVSLNQSGTEITTATSFMIETAWEHWGLTIQYAGPVYETDQYKINVEDISINLGYHMVF